MRVRASSTTALALGSAANGLLAYVFYALVTRHLGATASAPVSVLWTYWSFAAAALTFPLQHWIARSVAAHAGEAAVRAGLPSVVLAVVTAAAVAGTLGWLGRDALFSRDDLWFPLLVCWVTLGAGFIGVVRGGLSARHRFGAVALALAAENGLRCLAAAALIAAGTHAPLLFGACLAAGSLVGLAWPSSFWFGSGATERGGADGSDAAASPSAALAFLGGAAGGQLIAQAVLTGGPVVLALSGGTAAQVTALFAGLALFRAPYTIAIGLVSQLTGRLTTLAVQGRKDTLRRINVGVMAAALLGSLAAAAVGAAVGPLLVRVIFGSDVRLDPLASAVIAGGSVLALANLVAAIGILAQGRSAAITRAWVVSVIGGAALFALLRPEPLLRTSWAFTGAEVLALGALLVEQRRGLANLSPATGGAGESAAGESGSV